MLCRECGDESFLGRKLGRRIRPVQCGAVLCHIGQGFDASRQDVSTAPQVEDPLATRLYLRFRQGWASERIEVPLEQGRRTVDSGQVVGGLDGFLQVTAQSVQARLRVRLVEECRIGQEGSETNLPRTLRLCFLLGGQRDVASCAGGVDGFFHGLPCALQLVGRVTQEPGFRPLEQRIGAFFNPSAPTLIFAKLGDARLQSLGLLLQAGCALLSCGTSQRGPGWNAGDPPGLALVHDDVLCTGASDDLVGFEGQGAVSLDEPHRRELGASTRQPPGRLIEVFDHQGFRERAESSLELAGLVDAHVFEVTREKVGCEVVSETQECLGKGSARRPELSGLVTEPGSLLLCLRERALYQRMCVAKAGACIAKLGSVFQGHAEVFPDGLRMTDEGLPSDLAGLQDLDLVAELLSTALRRVGGSCLVAGAVFSKGDGLFD